jgi:hypothetical protein
MLELKSKNLFIKSGSVNIGISKILDFYDLTGKNILLLHYKGSTLSSIIGAYNKQQFTPSSLQHILSQHLFRLDLIIVDSGEDPWFGIEENYQTIRNITDLPVIFTIDIRKINETKNFDTAYILSKKSEISIPLASLSSLNFDRLEDYLVESIKEGWKTNLKELKIQYIRDKNLRDLLGEDE